MSKAAGMPLKRKTASMKMQSHRETTQNSRATHSAAAFVLAVVLGGCGSGGGGGSPGATPNVSYPTLSNAVINSANSGVTSNYSLTGATLTPLSGTVSVLLNSPTQSSLTITVTALGSEPTFSFTVNNPATVGPPLANSPLSSCAACLLAGSVTSNAPDSQPVSFIYLDPSVAGLTYSTLGLWSKPTSVVGTDVGAALSIGVVTRTQDLPLFGTATYNGIMVGRYTDSSHAYAVGANVTAVVTFGLSGGNPAPSVTFSTTNTLRAMELVGGTLSGPLLQSVLNLISPGSFTYSGTSTNSVTGTLTALGVTSLMTGSATAKFYGPPTGAQAIPPEFGGAFFVGNGLEQMNGSFSLKR